MKQRLQQIQALADRAAILMAGVGAAIILVQTIWISYGVVMRYVFRSPDRLATEATALLLFPVAFTGLTYALREDALPRVDILTEVLWVRARQLIAIVNMGVMVSVGGFLAVTAVRATYSSYLSGAASEILVWPKFIFWVPTALSLVIFTLYAGLRFAWLLCDIAEGEPTDGVV